MRRLVEDGKMGMWKSRVYIPGRWNSIGGLEVANQKSTLEQYIIPTFLHSHLVCLNYSSDDDHLVTEKCFANFDKNKGDKCPDFFAFVYPLFSFY